MKPLPQTPALERVARRNIWFESPEKALADPVRFAAYVLTYGMHEDVQTLRSHMSDEDFRYAIEYAPPGIFDPRSWTYWNLKIDRYPPPPMPQRVFDAP